MDDISIFADKAARPTDKELTETLSSTYDLWKRIYDFVLSKYPSGLAEWHYPGKKYGWNFRIRDKKRAIIYFLPRAQFFKVAFVFGDKAVNEIMSSGISDDIKMGLSQATKYAEGRGIRLDIINDSIIPDIKHLIEIKLKY